jgi:hypothetical protein
VDNVDGPVQVSCNARSGQTFPLGSTTVQCSATDAAGTPAQGSFEIVIRDDAPPVLRLPENISAQATGRAGSEITFSPTASDQVDGAIPVVCTPASGTPFAVGTTTVNCTAADRSGNAASGSFSVSVRDSVAPVMSVPENMSVQAATAAGAQVAFNVTASDGVDGNLSVSCTPRAGSVFPIGQTTVTCRVSDQAGNSTTRTFNVTVADTVAPRLELPSTITAAATSANGAPVSFSTTATDTIDGPVTASCSPRSGSTFPLGTTPITCRATDTRGNQTTGTFNVVVRDTVAPVLTLSDVLTVEAESAAGAVVNFNAVARDAIDGAIPANCTPAAGATFPLGSTSVRCTATDKSGNTVNQSVVVKVFDTRAPALRLPDNISARAITRGGTAVTFTVSAFDTVDGSLSPICTPRSGSAFGIGETTVSCRVTDTAGNAAAGAFKVTVLNNTPPVLVMPANQTVEATGASGAVVSFTVTANSIVDGPLAPVCTPAPGSTFPLGTTPVTCRATDDSANSVTDRFNVTVVDTNAPALVLPPTQTAEANNGRRGATVNFNVTATDLVDTAVATACTPRPGSTFDIGTTAVTCRATDRSNNVMTGTFNVVVQDTVGPVITAPGNVTAEATSGAGATVSFDVTATDAADGAVQVICTPRSGSTFPLGTTTVNCTASDQANHSAPAASFNVTVNDTQAPTLIVPENISTPAINASGAPVSFTVSASDVVDGPITPVCTPASGSVFPIGATPVVCTATDKAGIAVSRSFVVTVNRTDNEKPALILPGTITVQSTSDAGAVVNYTATANDNMDGPVPVTCTPASGSTFSMGPTKVDCFAADRSGNTAEGRFMVVVTPVPNNNSTPPPEPTTIITPAATLTATVVAQPPPNGSALTPLSNNSSQVSSTTELTQTVGLPPSP